LKRQSERLRIEHSKSSKRLMARTIIRETKREGQKMHNMQDPKQGRELIPLMVGNYFTHNPSKVTCMQIVGSNSNGRSKTSVTKKRGSENTQLNDCL
jgi:hypothetical protein